MQDFDAKEIESFVFIAVIGLIALAVILQWWRYIRWSIVYRHSQTKTTAEKLSYPPVSVVMATRNENAELLQSLPFFLSQDYPDYELVLVVDDNDQDLLYQLKEYENKYSQLKVVRFVWTRNFFLARKFAEAIGVKSAKHDYILISTATSRPNTELWIRSMIGPVDAQNDLWIGFYKGGHKRSVLSQFMAYDELLQAQACFAAAIHGNPYSGDIHNFGFKKSSYFAVSGIAEYYNVDTGNEAMLISKIANKNNVQVNLGNDAAVRSVTDMTLAQWIHAKRRSLLMTPAFPVSIRLSRQILDTVKLLTLLAQIILLIGFATHTLMLAGFQTPIWAFIVTAFVLKWAVIWPITYQNMNAIGAKVNLLLMPLFDAINVLLYPLFFVSFLFSKRVTWNSCEN